MEKDLLYDLVEEKHPNKKTTAEWLVIVLFSLKAVIGISVLYVSFKSLSVQTNTLMSAKIFLLVVATQNLLPLIALLLFILRQKTGWIFIVILSLIQLVSTSIFFINLVSHIQVMLEKRTILTLISTIINFILSVIITYLLFAKPITARFKISNKTKLISIAVAIVLFVLLKYYIDDFLVRTVSKR